MLKLQYLVSKNKLQIKYIHKRLSISDQKYSSYPTSFSSSFYSILISVFLIYFFLPLLPPIYLPAIGSIPFYWFEGSHSSFHFPLTFLFLLPMIFYFPIFSFLLFIYPTFCSSIPLNSFPSHIHCIKRLSCINLRGLGYQIMQKY